MNRYIKFLLSIVVSFSLLIAPVYASSRPRPVDPEAFPTDESIINVCSQIIQQKFMTSGHGYPTTLNSTFEIKIPQR